MSMSGIPAICVIATALVPVPAPSAIQIQAAATTAMRAVTTTKRSRRNTASSIVVSAAIITAVRASRAAELPFVVVERVEHAVLVPGDVRQRAVPAVQVEFDRPHALGKTRGVLGLVKHPAVWQHCDNPLLLVGHRVADRFAVRRYDAGDLDPRPPFLEIPFALDLGKQRMFDRLDHCRENLEQRADRLVRTGEYVEQSLALGLVGALVEDRLH